MTTAKLALNVGANATAVDSRLDRTVGRPVLPEMDCEDQGFGDVRDGCNNWPCYRTPLVRWRLGWRCPKCGGCY